MKIKNKALLEEIINLVPNERYAVFNVFGLSTMPKSLPEITKKLNDFLEEDYILLSSDKDERAFRKYTNRLEEKDYLTSELVPFSEESTKRFVKKYFKTEKMKLLEAWSLFLLKENDKDNISIDSLTKNPARGSPISGLRILEAIESGKNTIIDIIKKSKRHESTVEEHLEHMKNKKLIDFQSVEYGEPFKKYSWNKKSSFENMLKKEKIRKGSLIMKSMAYLFNNQNNEQFYSLKEILKNLNIEKGTHLKRYLRKFSKKGYLLIDEPIKNKRSEIHLIKDGKKIFNRIKFLRYIISNPHELENLTKKMKNDMFSMDSYLIKKRYALNPINSFLEYNKK